LYIIPVIASKQTPSGSEGKEVIVYRRVGAYWTWIIYNGKKIEKINPQKLRYYFCRAMRIDGIKQFRWHDLSHTFSTRLAQAGVDLYKISKLSGHKDIKMTQCYAHHCPDSLRDGVEILETDYNEEKTRGSKLYKFELSFLVTGTNINKFKKCIYHND